MTDRDLQNYDIYIQNDYKSKLIKCELHETDIYCDGSHIVGGNIGSIVLIIFVILCCVAAFFIGRNFDY